MVVPPTAFSFASGAKAEARDALKRRRRDFVASLSESARKNAATELAARVRNRIEAHRVVAAFLPIGDEIDPSPLIEQLAEDGAVIALPHVTRRTEPLHFLIWRPGTPVVNGPFGLRQPDITADKCAPDVILTPLLGFDAPLHRIGYGAGYYDRAFAAYPAARRIGLAWSVQQIETIPTDPWDVRLHAVATEKGWIE